jgi:hypothetical protein
VQRPTKCDRAARAECSEDLPLQPRGRAPEAGFGRGSHGDGLVRARDLQPEGFALPSDHLLGQVARHQSRDEITRRPVIVGGELVLGPAVGLDRPTAQPVEPFGEPVQPFAQILGRKSRCRSHEGVVEHPLGGPE